MSTYNDKLTAHQKDGVRSFFYSRLSRRQLRNAYQVILASQDCGDIHHFNSLRIDLNRVIATDLDAIAVRNAKTLGVNCQNRDIRLTVDDALRASFELGSINLDLCCTAQEGVPILKDILRAEAPFTSFTYAISRCRMGSGLSSESRALFRYNYIVQTVGRAPFFSDKYYSSTADNAIGTWMGIMFFAGQGRQAKELYPSDAIPKFGPNPIYVARGAKAAATRYNNAQRASAAAKKAWITRRANLAAK